MWMRNWKGCARLQSQSNLRYHPSICLEGVRKTKENCSQDSWCLGRDPNWSILNSSLKQSALIILLSTWMVPEFIGVTWIIFWLELLFYIKTWRTLNMLHVISRIIHLISQFYGTLWYSAWLQFTVFSLSLSQRERDTDRQTDRDTDTHTPARTCMCTLVSMSSLLLLGRDFQWRTVPFLWIPKLTPASAISFWQQQLTMSKPHQFSN
jgi:hypothetical protein